MKDLQNTKLMWLKAVLFLLIGATSSALLWSESPTFRTVLLILLSIWSLCRAYYFAFYVLERYVDPQFKFAGLGSLILYVLKSSRRR